MVKSWYSLYGLTIQDLKGSPKGENFPPYRLTIDNLKWHGFPYKQIAIVMIFSTVNLITKLSYVFQIAKIWYTHKFIYVQQNKVQINLSFFIIIIIKK